MLSADTAPGRTITIDGRSHLFFSGFSYFGLAQDADFKKLIHEGLDKYGVLFPSSRISNTRFSLNELFENAASAFTGTETAVSFSSGYLAAQAAAAFAMTKGKLLYAPDAHPALQINGQGPENQEWNAWADETLLAVNSGQDPLSILADAVNPLTAKVNNFSFLNKIIKPVTLIIDDSHGIGLLGEHGEGIISCLSENKKIDLVITFSMAKALGLEGGVICTSRKNSDVIKQLSHYTAGTGMIPSFMHTFIEAGKLYQKKRESLKSLIRYFIQHGPTELFNFDDRLPVFSTTVHRLYEHCIGAGIIISSFSYPVASGNRVTRVVLNSEHSFADLDVLITCLKKYR